MNHHARDGGIIVSARLLTPGLYDVPAAASMIGPYRSVGRLPVSLGTRKIRLNNIPPAYYRFEPRVEPVPVR